MTDQKQHHERQATPGQSEQPLNATNAELDTSSAQEQHVQDDQARAEQQRDAGEHPNPNEPLPSDEQEGRVGEEGQEQGSEPPRGSSDENQRNVEEAVRRTEEAIDSGAETPA